MSLVYGKKYYSYEFSVFHEEHDIRKATTLMFEVGDILVR